MRAVVLLVLLAGAALRLASVGYGIDTLSFQIDEDRNVSLPLHLAFSDLRPRDPGYSTFYDYPALFWYLLFGVDRLVCWVGQGFRLVKSWEGFVSHFATDPIPYFLLGRTVSVVFGTATIGLLYLLGRDLFSPSHGLLGALFLACTFLHVRDSALATVDALAGFFVLLALVGAGSVLRGGGRGAYLLAGAAAGLATATKYNAIVVLTGLVVAHGLRTVRSGLSLARALVVPSLLGGFVIAGVVFLAVNPYLILDWPKARADLAWQFERVRVGQFVGQPIDVGPAWWYHFTVSLRYGMGVAMLGLAVLGAVAATWRRHPGAWVSGSFAASSFVVVGSAKLAFVRYMTPLLPVLCLFAAGAVLILAGRVPWRRGRPWVVAGLAGLAVAEPLAAITAYSGMVHHTDTRVQAYRFLLTLPPDSDVATYGPSEVWRSTFPPARFWGPTYYAKHPQQTWEDVFGALKAQGSNYLLVHTASLDAYSPTVPDLERALRHSAVLVQTFSPYRPGAEVHPFYDRADPFYFPVGRFRGVIRPGPLIRLYRLG